MIYIVRKEHFNAAHKLLNPNWSDKKNLEEFGVCSNENWHGHNYEIEVTVKGKINPESGMLINLKVLSKILKEEILDKVDHKNLNLDVPFLEGIITTTENVTIKFWGIKIRLEHARKMAQPPASLRVITAVKKVEYMMTIV